MDAKADLKRELDSYRARRGELRLVDVPPMSSLMADGRGDPNTSPEFSAALGALYPVAYGLKFLSKRELGRDYVVMPLEGLWWADDPAAFAAGDRAAWRWTAMIAVPGWTEREAFEAVVARVRAKGAPARLDDVRLETLEEGRCMQTLHVGPFADEGPVIARLHAEIADQGLALTGRHHEIYLSDLRRSAPERLRTILRQPVADAP
ncbi:GyrI-like domain-containing protein [Demequina soli]|uniref:GyrI-like domain-containing protein n=1 Tax=Demequina soli TaxID=1638987 RepID=UPI00078302C5|nr:GyrI-like domain-containing protein [Demequina soli]